MPRPQRGPSVRAGLFRKDEFEYDPESDTVVCPGGQRLQPYSSSLLRGLKKINYASKQACRDCPIRSRCTNNSFRSVSRMENEAVLDRMQARLSKRPEVSINAETRVGQFAALAHQGRREGVHSITVCLICIALPLTEFLPWLGALGAGVWISCYIQTSERGVGNIGTQAAIVLIITLVQGWAPPTSILPGIERFAGMAAGLTILLVVTMLIWPDPEPERRPSAR